MTSLIHCLLPVASIQGFLIHSSTSTYKYYPCCLFSLIIVLLCMTYRGQVDVSVDEHPYIMPPAVMCQKRCAHRLHGEMHEHQRGKSVCINPHEMHRCALRHHNIVAKGSMRPTNSEVLCHSALEMHGVPLRNILKSPLQNYPYKHLFIDFSLSLLRKC